MSRCEYWTLNRMNGISKVNVTISWSSNSCGVTTIGDLRVARWDVASTKWKDHGNNGTTGNATSGTVLSTTQPTTYGTFTLGSSTNNNPLPVELSEFTAELINSSVVINWKTMSEIFNIVYLDELKEDDTAVLSKLFAFAGALNVENIKILNVNTGFFFKPINEHLMIQLDRAFGLEKIKLETVDGSDVKEGIDHYLENHHVDLLVMSTHKKSFLERLFSKSNTNEMAMYGKIPLLVYHKE